MPHAHAQPFPHETRTLLVLAAIQFTHILDFMIMMPLGSQLMRVFTISPAQFGHLVAAYGVAAAITGFLAAFVVDRFDRKHALLGLYAGFSLATLACALAPNYAALMIARIFAGSFGGVAGSIVVAMVGDVIPPARRGRGMGLVMTAFPLATILGVPLGLWLATRFEWHAPFFMLTGLSIAIFALGAKLLPSIRSTHHAANPRRQMIEILGHPIHQRGLLMTAFLVFAGGSVIPFVAPSMVANSGISEKQLPWLYLTGGAATLITTPIIGRLSDRHDKLHVFGWASSAAILAVLIITHLHFASIAAAACAMALFMVTMSGRFSPVMSMLTNSIEARYRAGFMSVNSAVQQAASSLAAIVAGRVVSETASGQLRGFPTLGYVSVACLLITFALAARLRAAAPHAARPGGAAPVIVADAT